MLCSGRARCWTGLECRTVAASANPQKMAKEIAKALKAKIDRIAPPPGTSRKWTYNPSGTPS
jgi:hypothetical protein